MKLVYIIAVLGVTVLIIGSFNSDNTSDAESTMLVVEPRHIDLGDIAQGESKVATFNVRNTTPQSISVEKLTISCGCTSATIEPKLIAAGESAVLRAEMSNYGRMGKFIANIDIQYSHLSHRSANSTDVTIEANAQQVAVVHPSAVDFGYLQEDSKPQAAEVVIQKGNSSTAWSTIECTSEYSNISINAVDEVVGGKSTIKIQLDPAGLQLGAFKSEVEVALKSEDGSIVQKIPILINAKVMGDVNAMPSSFYYGAIRGGVKIRGELRVTSETSHPLKIVHVYVEGLRGEIIFDKPLSDSSGTILNFEFISPKEEGNFSGKIIVMVGSENRPKSIGVPIIGFVKNNDDNRMN